MISNTQRRIIKEKLPPIIEELYTGDEQIDLNENLTKKYHISNIGRYVEIVGDTILGFHRTTELPRLFQSELDMSADEAQRLTSDLLDFLSPVIEKEADGDRSITKEDLEKLSQTFAEAKANQVVTEKEEVIESEREDDIQPVRTMNTDMNRVHGYGAYREQNPLPEEEPVVQSEQASVLSDTPPTSIPVPTQPETTQATETIAPPTPAAQPPAQNTPPATAQTQPAPPNQANQPKIEEDGSVRVPINSPLKSPDATSFNNNNQ